MSVLAEWKATRERRKRAAAYVVQLTADADLSGGEWLIELSPLAEDTVRLELRLALQAIGLIVAERDSLDDNTAADVNHELQVVIREEGKGDESTTLIWRDRWNSYSGAMMKRGVADAPAIRLARILLIAVGVLSPSAVELERTACWILERRRWLNVALREAYGDVLLPEDIRPSELGSS